MMKQLKKRISKGEKAMQASGYILPRIAYIIKKIKDDIKRDISQAEDAKKMMMNKSLNKE